MSIVDTPIEQAYPARETASVEGGSRMQDARRYFSNLSSLRLPMRLHNALVRAGVTTIIQAARRTGPGRQRILGVGKSNWILFQQQVQQSIYDYLRQSWPGQLDQFPGHFGTMGTPVSHILYRLDIGGKGGEALCEQRCWQVQSDPLGVGICKHCLRRWNRIRQSIEKGVSRYLP